VELLQIFLNSTDFICLVVSSLKLGNTECLSIEMGLDFNINLKCIHEMDSWNIEPKKIKIIILLATEF